MNAPVARGDAHRFQQSFVEPTMTSDKEQLYAAIMANPLEDTPRLMYADHLDELGGQIGCVTERNTVPRYYQRVRTKAPHLLEEPARK